MRMSGRAGIGQRKAGSRVRSRCRPACTRHKEAEAEVERAQVGDRYVQELMAEKGWLLGGEASGHIICADLTTTGDGIVAALQVMAAMARSGETLVALKSELHKLPQTLINVGVRDGFVLEEAEKVIAASQHVEDVLGDRGRLVLRSSGTEPLIRVMIEGADAKENQRLAEGVAEAIRQSH